MNILKTVTALVFSLAFGLSATAERLFPSYATNEAMTLDAARYVQLDALAGDNAMNSADGMKLMRELSSELTPYYQDLIYRNRRVDVLNKILWNLGTGGLGSVQMGDAAIGWTLTIGALATSALTTVVMTNMLPRDISDNLAIGSIVGGAAISLLGITIPLISGTIRNSRLSQALSR